MRDVSHEKCSNRKRKEHHFLTIHDFQLDLLYPHRGQYDKNRMVNKKCVRQLIGQTHGQKVGPMRRFPEIRASREWGKAASALSYPRQNYSRDAFPHPFLKESGLILCCL